MRLTTLSGTAADANGVLSVTVNGQPAQTSNGFATWTFPAFLADGANAFVIVARDHAEPANSASLTATIIAIAADTDGDGLPDEWETQFGLDGSDATGRSGAFGDFDNDGLANALELLANLDPNRADAASASWATIEIKPEDGRRYLVLHHRQRSGLFGWKATLESSLDLLTWSAAPSLFEPAAPPTLLPDDITQVHHHRVLHPIGTPGPERANVRLRVTAD